MIFTVEELAIEQYELDKIRPATIIDRNEGEIWLVREQPFETELSPRYLMTVEHAHVRIPLFPYLTRGTTPSVAMGMAMKLGILAVNELYDSIGRHIVPQVDIVRTHIVLGQPVQDLSSSLRFWCGVGFLITRRN
jgi:hypothetical protein